MTTEPFDQRRAWLDDLLSKPHLWPAQVQIVKLLAAELAIPVTFYRLSLNDPGAGWKVSDQQ